MCHRLVRCTVCDLVYASEPPAQSELAHAYHVADYDSSEEANDAAQSYISAMQPLLAVMERKDRVLEIGSGTGALLEMLNDQGFTEMIGVEPSAAAISAAPSHRRSWLRQEIFLEKHFEPQSFDLICCFMTLEHVRDPMSVAEAAKRLLRPGGAFVTVTHDYRGFVNRILGKRSPIIDIEHMQLFSKRSLRKLFERSGFETIELKSFCNRYALRYWVRLLPVNSRTRRGLTAALEAIGVADLRLRINVGNILSYGYKL